MSGWRAMHLVQLLVPLRDERGARFDAALYRQLRAELTERFGGLTVYSRAPAEGLWQEDDDGAPTHDDIVVVEVMVEALDAEWWSGYRRELERRFRQEELVVRALGLQRL